MSSDWQVMVYLKHDDKNKMADFSVRDPLCFKNFFTNGCEVFEKKDEERWLCFSQVFSSRMAPLDEVMLRCKLAHTEGWDYHVVYYETLDHFEDLLRTGITTESHNFNGICTDKIVVDHGNWKLKKRKTPTAGALIAHGKMEQLKGADYFERKQLASDEAYAFLNKNCPVPEDNKESF